MGQERSNDVRDTVSQHPLWYHTIELAPGVTTPGWFDLRPIVDQMPWPDVKGKRCLDVGTYDGFLAFELERRGAVEVVAVDIDDHDQWDWPPDVRARGAEQLAVLAGPEKGGGFRIAATALRSRVERRAVSVYDLSPEVVGTFDVVTCGSLLLHLRDPLRALEAIRSVCAGVFLSAETIDLRLTLLHPRSPAFRLNGVGGLCQWTIPNRVGHAQMLRASGFALQRRSRVYAIPFGPAHPPTGRSLATAGALALQRLICGRVGVPHVAALAVPVV